MKAQVGAIEAVIAAVKSGEISQQAIKSSVTRILRLKAKYLSPSTTKAADLSVNIQMLNEESSKLASGIYAKSTTVIRTEPGYLPIEASPKSLRKILLVSASEAHLGGGAIDSGEDRDTQSLLLTSCIDEILLPYCESLVNIKLHKGYTLGPDHKDMHHFVEADLIILTTRNANFSPYQKTWGRFFGNSLLSGKKLIVVATSDPYDFLEDIDTVRNYIAIYEPTLAAFQAAVDVIFGVKPAQGRLPVCLPKTKPSNRSFPGTEE